MTCTTFDWQALLDRLGGDEDFVRSLLDVALRSSEALPEELRRASASGDFTTLARLAHKIKGTAGDLVAASLQGLARETEVAARTTDPLAIGLGRELGDSLDRLLEELRKVVSGRAG